MAQFKILCTTFSIHFWMSLVRYGLLCWGRASRTKITEINKLINRETRYMHFKSWNENVSSIKKLKNISMLKTCFGKIFYRHIHKRYIAS